MIGTTARPRLGGRATIAGLVLAAGLTTGGAAAATATAAPVAPGAAASTVGVASQGVRIGSAPITAAPAKFAAGSAGLAAAAYWVDVYSKVSGARLRAWPVGGTVLRLISYGQRFWVSCKRMFSDGYYWGYASVNGQVGWVRADLWGIVQYTYPSGTPYVGEC